MRERDAGHDNEDQRDHLVRLAPGDGRPGDPVRKRLALLARGHEDRATGGADEHAGDPRQAVGGEREVREHARRAGDRAATGVRERDGEARAPGHARRECPRDRGARAEGEVQHQRRGDRRECADRVPVVERVVEARTDCGHEPGDLVLREPRGVQARHERQQADERQSAGQPVEHVAALAANGGDPERQQEDAQVGGDPRQLGRGLAGALRPGDAERRPRHEAAQGHEHHERATAQQRQWQQAGDGSPAQQPPDGEAELAVDDGVVAAALQAQVHDDRERHDPARHRVQVEPA